MTAQSRNTQAPPFRLALSLPCGASGAAYTAGALDFLVHALHAWELARLRREPGVPRWRVQLAEVAGASFGGVTAALFSASVHFRHDALLSHFAQSNGGGDGDNRAADDGDWDCADADDGPPNNALYDAWVRRFGPALLLRARAARCSEKPAHTANLFSATFVTDLLEASLPTGPVAPRPPWLAAPLGLTLTALNPPTAPAAGDAQASAKTPPPPQIPAHVHAHVHPNAHVHAAVPRCATAASEETISYVTDATCVSPVRSATRWSASPTGSLHSRHHQSPKRHDYYDDNSIEAANTVAQNTATAPYNGRTRNCADFVRLHFPAVRPTLADADAHAVPPDSVPVPPAARAWGSLLSAARATVAYPVAPGGGSSDDDEDAVVSYRRHTTAMDGRGMRYGAFDFDPDREYDDVYEEEADDETWASLALSDDPAPLSAAALRRELADALRARGARDADGGTGAIVQIAAERPARRNSSGSDSEAERGALASAPLRVLQRSFCRVGGIVMDFRGGGVAGAAYGSGHGAVRQGRPAGLETQSHAPGYHGFARVPDVRGFELAPADGALACDALGAFGGLLGRAVRQHDFLLGRYDCQRFLREALALDAAEMRTRAAFRGLVPADATGRLPIIPLLGDADVPLKRPTWPVLRKRERRRVVADVGRLVERRLTEALETTERSEKAYLDDAARGGRGSRGVAGARRCSEAVVRKAVRWRVLRACRRHVRCVLKDATAVFGTRNAYTRLRE